MSAPQSIINMCSGVRLDARQEHSIFFANAAAQQSYFAGKVVKTFSAYSYLRKSWNLQVAATMEQAKTWSYLYFRNGTGKFYYYFITDIEYRNEGMVELQLELDVLQTYLFDFTLLPSFIERQHTATDTLGEHTIDEGLELGEFVVNKSTDMQLYENLCILVLSTFNPNYADTDEPVPALSGMYNGVLSGLKVWAIHSSQWGAWGSQLDSLSENGFIDGIVGMWMYPQNLVQLGGENTWSDGVLCKVVSGCSTGVFSVDSALDGTVNGYTPKNKKLFSFPFNYLYVSNNAGASAVYRYERCNTFGGFSFHAYGAVSPDAGLKIAPTDYNGALVNYEEGLHLGDFPACAWDADMYKLWLAQNRNQHALTEKTATISAVAGAATMIGSALTGNLMGAVGGAGAVYGAAMQVSQLMAQKRDAAIQPPQARGSFSANVNISAGKQTFTVQRKTVDAEHARAIDDYFTMYGYRLNRVQTPNIHARPAYTYVKTVGCNLQGNLCNADLNRIQSIFDKGVTFWVNGDRISDYTQANTV